VTAATRRPPSAVTGLAPPDPTGPAQEDLDSPPTICTLLAMFTTLMTTRRFAPLFWCQFFSAFNDNFLKNSLVFLILFKLAGADAESLITLAGATLMFPFFALSAIGGEMADRYDKARVAERLKFFEIGVAALAVGGFGCTRFRCCFSRCFCLASLRRCSARSNTASCPIISRAPNCPPATP
jgi:hypothetical protein